MEIFLWFIIPLLILSLTLFSWLLWADDWHEPFVYFLSRVARTRQHTAGFWGRHGVVVRFTNRLDSGSTSGNAELTAGHWTLAG